MLFRQLFDRETSTYTYLLADDVSREAVLIDTVASQKERDLTLLAELNLKLLYLLETHVHADHVTASGPLREATGAKIAYSARAGVEGADVFLEDGETLHFGSHTLEARLTPGHTPGDVTFVLGEASMAFTGDTLLIRGCGRTDFQGGCAKALFDSVRRKIFSLPEATLLYPGHDYAGRTVTSVGEERQHNKRLKDGVSEDEFVNIMNALTLPKPKKIDVAVPENLKLGLGYRPGVERREDGVPEVSCAFVAEKLPSSRTIDVREDDEVKAGIIAGAEHVPLATVAKAAESWDRSTPLIVYCRSGGRSGRAALELERLGFDVVSMRGGTLAWAAEGRALSQRDA